MGTVVGEALLAYGMEAGSAALIEAGAFIASHAVAINAIAAIAVTSAQAQAAKRKARNAMAAAAQDRHITLRAAASPRREVLGRAVTGGDLLWAASTGATKDTLAMIIAISARQIDAVEQVFIGGEPVTMDVDGYVETAPYGGTVRNTAVEEFTYAGPASFTLASDPIDGSVYAMTLGVYDAVNGVGTAEPVPVVSVVGKVVQLGSLAYTGQIRVIYQVLGRKHPSIFGGYSGPSAIRITIHKGEPGQVVDPTVSALFPTEWDATHKLEGIAYAVVLCKYDTDAFFQGLKNVSFLTRGSLIHDPRTGTTAWSDNLALLARHVCLNPLDPTITPMPVSDSWCIAAANVCDQVVNYTVDSVAKSRKRYVGGTVYSEGEPVQKTLDELAQAMAGSWIPTEGEVRMRAGAYAAPVFTLTDADFGPGAVQVLSKTPREELVNVANAKAFDPDNRWQYVDVPEVRSSAYITEDGSALPLQVELPAVNDMAQAQQILAVMMREARTGFTLTANFRMRAYPLQVFDTVSLQCTRYLGAGVAVPCLVLARKWSLAGGIVLTLRATGASIYADGAVFDPAAVPGANLLPVPWQVAEPANVLITSDPAQVGDATQSSRLRVSWDAYIDRSVINGGAIEIQYRPADEVEPAGDWPGVTVSGRATTETIRGLQQARYYLVRLRAWNGLAFSRWTVQKLALVGAVPLIQWAEITGAGRPADGATVNRLYSSATDPALSVSVVDGDQWRDTSTTPIVIKLRVAGTWVSAANLSTGALAQLDQVGTGQIAAGAATDLVFNSESSTTRSGRKGTAALAPPAGLYRSVVASWTNSTAAAVSVEVSTSIVGKYVSGPGSIYLGGVAHAFASPPASEGFDNSDALAGMVDATAGARSMSQVQVVSVPAGSTLYASTFLIINYGGSTATDTVASITSAEVRIAAIKR